MKIGIDGRFAEGQLTGIGKYIYGLSRYLRKEGIDVVVFYTRIPQTCIEGVKTIIIKSVNSLLYEQILLPIALKKENIDIFHEPGNYGISIFCPCPSVLTIHDIIPILEKDYFKNSKLGYLSKILYFFRLYISLYVSKKVFCVSKYTYETLISKFKINRNKIRIIGEGVIIEGKGNNILTNRKKYIINNGGIAERKNLDVLIKAFSIVENKFQDVKLIITGNNEKLIPKLKELSKSLKIEKKVIFPGYVSQKKLSSLMKESFCLCFPSRMEGFGLPVIEAYSEGVPVITSKFTSLSEVGKNSAILINPNDVNDIARAILLLLTDKKLSASLVIKGKKKLKQYTWELNIKKIINEYKKIII